VLWYSADGRSWDYVPVPIEPARQASIPVAIRPWGDKLLVPYYGSAAQGALILENPADLFR
jgi:hypothetical protein